MKKRCHFLGVPICVNTLKKKKKLNIIKELSLLLFKNMFDHPLRIKRYLILVLLTNPDEQ
jgi:hypothetical protein